MMKSPSGWLVLNKPENISSAQLVGKVKWLLRKNYNKKIKVGHTGTLDPFATGVLPLVIGESTKLASFAVNSNKEYEFEVKWGDARNTGDVTGDTIGNCDYIPAISSIENILPKFKGKLKQKPHIFSAIKIDGKRAYSLARQGQDVPIKEREIEIFDLDILYHNDNITTFKVSCSKGTYIRSLTEDMAKSLNSLGHVTKLNRTKVGNFSIEDAIILDNIKENIYKNIVSSEDVLDGIAAIELNEEQKHKICHGNKIILSMVGLPEIFFLKYKGNIIAIAEQDNGYIKPKRILNL